MTVCVTDQQASVGRTTIIVAHRLSTIQHADVIVVVEDGAIIEMGTQKELLAKQGRFYKLVVAQVYSNVIITLSLLYSCIVMNITHQSANTMMMMMKQNH